jgi:hypothetical protein
VFCKQAKLLEVLKGKPGEGSPCFGLGCATQAAADVEATCGGGGVADVGK